MPEKTTTFMIEKVVVFLLNTYCYVGKSYPDLLFITRY